MNYQQYTYQHQQKSDCRSNEKQSVDHGKHHNQPSNESQPINHYLLLPINFESKNYNLLNKKYKELKQELFAVNYLPKFRLDQKIVKKIKNILDSGCNKSAYLFGSQYYAKKVDSLKFERSYYLDELSFDLEESYEQKFYQNMIFPFSVFIMPQKSQSLQNQKIIMTNHLQSAIQGLMSFQNIDASPFLGELNEQLQKLLLPLKSTDLPFLNNFRVFLFFTNSSKNKDSVKVHKYIYFPKLDFKLRQISQPFKIVATPLSNILAKKSKKTEKESGSSDKKNNKKGIKFGFLTLDQNQRVLLFQASDPLLQQVPLIGVWLFGVQLPETVRAQQSLQPHPQPTLDDSYLIWAALSEFTKNRLIAHRFSFEEKKKRFIFVLFNSGESPQFFEVETLDKDLENLDDFQKKWVLIKNSEDVKLDKLSSNDFEFCYNQNLCIKNFDNEDNLLDSNKKETNQPQLLSQQPIGQSQLGNNCPNQNIGLTQLEAQNDINSQLANNKNINSNQPPHSQSNNQDNQIKPPNETLGDLNAVIIQSQQQPQLQTSQNEEDLQSKQSTKSASFANNQTFANGSTNSSFLGLDFSNENKLRELKLPPIAENFFQQLQEQNKFLQMQVTQLQNALIKAQTQTNLAANQCFYQPSAMNTPNPIRTVSPMYKSYYMPYQLPPPYFGVQTNDFYNGLDYNLGYHQFMMYQQQQHQQQQQQQGLMNQTQQQCQQQQQIQMMNMDQTLKTPQNFKKNANQSQLEATTRQPQQIVQKIPFQQTLTQQSSQQNLEEQQLQKELESNSFNDQSQQILAYSSSAKKVGLFNNNHEILNNIQFSNNNIKQSQYIQQQQPQAQIHQESNFSECNSQSHLFVENVPVYKPENYLNLDNNIRNNNASLSHQKLMKKSQSFNSQAQTSPLQQGNQFNDITNQFASVGNNCSQNENQQFLQIDQYKQQMNQNQQIFSKDLFQMKQYLNANSRSQQKDQQQFYQQEQQNEDSQQQMLGSDNEEENQSMAFNNVNKVSHQDGLNKMQTPLQSQNVINEINQMKNNHMFLNPFETEETFTLDSKGGTGQILTLNTDFLKSLKKKEDENQLKSQFTSNFMAANEKQKRGDDKENSYDIVNMSKNYGQNDSIQHSLKKQKRQITPEPSHGEKIGTNGIKIPTIRFETTICDSESSDEEEIKKLEMRYMKQIRK